MIRYSQITHKRPREMVLLKGRPCAWGRCAFCDYIDDNDADDKKTAALNAEVLKRVTGQYGALEVINSGSVFELPEATFARLREIVREKGIKTLYFESHWSYRERLHEIEEYFGIPIIFKCGVETFDDQFRNQVLRKGMVFSHPSEVSRYFQSVCLMVGIQGQTRKMICKDIEILRRYFKLGCVNVYVNNSTAIRRDDALADWFCKEYRWLEQEPNIDVLFDICDYGVGGEKEDETT